MRARVRSGDPEAFRELFGRHARAGYNHGFRLTGTWVVAEEVVALTFLEAWRLRAKVDPDGGSLLPWLLGIATNVARNTARAARRHQAALARLPVEPATPDFADEVVAPPERDLPPSRHRALEAFLTSELTRTEAPATPSYWWRHRPVLVPAVAVVVAVAVGLTILVTTRQPAPAAPIPAPEPVAQGNGPAVRLLARAAGVADQQTPPAVGDTQYTYVDSMVAFAQSSASVGPDGTLHPESATGAGTPYRRQVWIPHRRPVPRRTGAPARPRSRHG